MLQFKDVHSLGVAGSTEELGIHAEHQGADVHIPGGQAKTGHFVAQHSGHCLDLLTEKRMGRKETHTWQGAPCLAAAEPVS